MGGLRRQPNDPRQDRAQVRAGADRADDAVQVRAFVGESRERRDGGVIQVCVWWPYARGDATPQVPAPSNGRDVSLYGNSAHTVRRNYVGRTGCPGGRDSYADASETDRARAGDRSTYDRRADARPGTIRRMPAPCAQWEGGTVTSDLEGFVSQPGRAEAIEAVQRQIVEQGVEYMYYQFVSVTGRIMGKGIPAAHWERIANAGFQLVYGSTANLFTDRHGNYIGYGPEARELVGIAEPETFNILPWDPKTARVWCTLFRGREEEVDGGAFLTSDCRGNLKRIHAKFTEGHRTAPSGRHRARDDVAEGRRRRQAHRRGQDEAVLLPHRSVLRAAAVDPQGHGVRQGDGPGHDPGRSRRRARASSN